MSTFRRRIAAAVGPGAVGSPEANAEAPSTTELKPIAGQVVETVPTPSAEAPTVERMRWPQWYAEWQTDRVSAKRGITARKRYRQALDANLARIYPKAHWL